MVRKFELSRIYATAMHRRVIFTVSRAELNLRAIQRTDDQSNVETFFCNYICSGMLESILFRKRTEDECSSVYLHPLGFGFDLP